MRSLPIWIAAAWAGSLVTLCFLVVPQLFLHLPSKPMAGHMAAQLFTAQTAISCVCAVSLLMLMRSPKQLVPTQLAKSLTLFVLGGLVVALLAEFGVAPHIVAHDNLPLWHAVGTALYGMQCLCALVTFAKLVQ